MPDDFPTNTFEATHQKLARFNKNELYSHFIGAWHAISYRYLALVEYNERFTSSIIAHGRAPAQPLRYQQERDLFGFFNNGVSIFDAFCYGMFALGALLVPRDFPLASPQDERKVNCASTLRGYNSTFQNDPILNALQALMNDQAYKELGRIRNILTHRAAPPRNLSLAINIGSGTAKPSAKILRLDLVIDNRTTAAHRDEIARLLSSVLQATQIFVETRC
jgi:hypothetical protein